MACRCLRGLLRLPTTALTSGPHTRTSTAIHAPRLSTPTPHRARLGLSTPPEHPAPRTSGPEHPALRPAQAARIQQFEPLAHSYSRYARYVRYARYRPRGSNSSSRSRTQHSSRTRRTRRCCCGNSKPARHGRPKVGRTLPPHPTHPPAPSRSGRGSSSSRPILHLRQRHRRRPHPVATATSHRCFVPMPHSQCAHTLAANRRAIALIDAVRTKIAALRPPAPTPHWSRTLQLRALTDSENAQVRTVTSVSRLSMQVACVARVRAPLLWAD